MSKKANYAWDSCVLIAWAADEAGAPLSDIDFVVTEIDIGEAVLILSVVTFTELLETRHTAEQLDKLNQFLRRSNVVKVEVSFKIAKKASDIRAAGQKEGRSITTPDAQILATAIVFQADVLHTLDDKLLKLDGSPIVDGLRITQPRTLRDTPALPFENPPQS